MTKWEVTEADKYCAHWQPGAPTTTHIVWISKTEPPEEVISYMKQYNVWSQKRKDGLYEIAFTLPVHNQDGVDGFYIQLKMQFDVAVSNPETWSRCMNGIYGEHGF